MTFESLRIPGQFLHVSATTHPETEPDHGQHEINFSVKPSSFTIHFHHSSDLGAQTLNGASVCQLLHKEQSAYVCAEGLFTHERVVEDVHLRIRIANPNKVNTLSPPTSAVGYWQIEFADVPLSGKPVSWDDVIRIRHVTTQQYLTFQENAFGVYVASLTRTRDEMSAFQLVPVTLKTATVADGEYVRIQHKSTGMLRAGCCIGASLLMLSVCRVLDACQRGRVPAPGPRAERWRGHGPGDGPGFQGAPTLCVDDSVMLMPACVEHCLGSSKAGQP